MMKLWWFIPIMNWNSKKACYRLRHLLFLDLTGYEALQTKHVYSSI